MNKNYTIRDVAKKLNLSRGTVDRVIHNREGVSEVTRQKVKAFLQEIDFKPNVLARSLKGSRPYGIYVLIPSIENDSYWESAKKGVQAAQEGFSDFALSTEIKYYDPGNPVHFQTVCQETLDVKPDGVLLAPLFYRESEKFFDDCTCSKIPLLTFNSFIEGSLSFIGQDLFKSGRVGADLLSRITNGNGKLLILHVDEDPSNSSHMIQKEQGFNSFFVEGEREQFSIETLNINFREKASVKLLKEVFSKDRTISGIFVSTSRTYRVAALLENLELDKVPLVGYDLVEENIESLKKGQIDFLINQNPFQQAYFGITYLFDYILFGKNPPGKKLLPIDIVSAENYETYIDAQLG